MSVATHDNFKIRVVRIPQWLLPLAAAAAVVLVGLLGLFGLGLLLLASPLILAAGLVHSLKAFRKPAEQPLRPSRRKSSDRPERPIFIDGDYVVLDDVTRAAEPEAKPSFRN
jgi:hypothetical protein